MKKVLFLCTHNSCRSQMAEGLINHFLGNRYQAFSAGTEATMVNQLAIEVMAELGIDMSKHFSKTLEELAGEQFDHVITLCGSANELCPVYVGGVKRVHIGFDDPSRTVGNQGEVMQDFRRVRDEIKERLIAYLARGQHE